MYQIPLYRWNAALLFFFFSSLVPAEQWATVCRGTVDYIFAEGSNGWKKVEGVTQQQQQQQQPNIGLTNSRHCLVGSVLGFYLCYSSLCGNFPLKYYFSAHGFESILSLILSSTAPLGKICRAVPWYTAIHPCTEPPNRRNTMPIERKSWFVCQVGQRSKVTYWLGSCRCIHMTEVWDRVENVTFDVVRWAGYYAEK